MDLTLILMAALLGAHSTYWLSHRTRLGAIRASALSSLFFVACSTPFSFFMIPKLQAAFFGATFVGMSDQSRLKERQILLATVIYAMIFSLLSYFRSGIGGTLGASAFLSCLIAFSIRARLRAPTVV